MSASSSSSSVLSSGVSNASSASPSQLSAVGEASDTGREAGADTAVAGGMGGGSSTRGDADAARPSLLSPPPSPQPGKNKRLKTLGCYK